MGIDHATRKMEFAEIPAAEDIESLPFEEAVEYLKKRNVLSAEEYYRLSDKMKFRAFTASRIADGDILKKINARIMQNTASGGTAADFLKYTRDELLDCVGMGSGNFSYWETVYRTNVQTAYNAGRAMGFEEDNPLALEFVGIDDARTSDICRSLLSPKIVLPYGDPFWQSHWPPLHFNCRSTVRGIYDESELPESYIQPDPLENPAKGFGKFPLDTDDWWQELASQTARAKEYGIQGEIERAFEKLVAKTNSVPEKIILDDESEVRKILDENKVSKKEVKMLYEKLTEPEIINKLGGGDKTKGSCISLTYAYASNKAGFDVIDFRGGASQTIFSKHTTTREICKLKGVVSKEIKNTNDFIAAKEALRDLTKNKEYCFITGKHGAIIRQTSDIVVEYLELQSSTQNGWKTLNEIELRKRFGCQKKHTLLGGHIIYENSTFLIDIETLTKNKEFINLMEYINTAEEKQMKGIKGAIK